MDRFSKLVEIGNNLASIWGGHCNNIKIHAEEHKVDFLCVEHGEDFVTSLSFDEIKKDYGVEL